MRGGSIGRSPIDPGRTVALAGLLLLASCTVSIGQADGPPSVAPPPPTTTTPTPSPLPAGNGAPKHCAEPLSGFSLTFDAQRGVTAADATQLQRETREARAYFRVKVPLCDRGRVVVRALDRSKANIAASTHVSDVPTFRIEVYAHGETFDRTPVAYRTVTMLHEWYHVLEFSYLDCGPPECRGLRGRVPDWLIEGAAVYASLRAADDLRILPFSLARSARIRVALADPDPLERLARIRTPGANYSVAFAAVEFLATLGGHDALRRFWEEAGATGRWQGAFQTVFGLSIDAFYRRFAAYRARGFHR